MKSGKTPNIEETENDKQLNLKEDLRIKLSEYDSEHFKEVILAMFDTKIKIDERYAFRERKSLLNDASENLINPEVFVLVLCTQNTANLDHKISSQTVQSDLLEWILKNKKKDDNIDSSKIVEEAQNLKENGTVLEILKSEKRLSKHPSLCQLLTSHGFQQLQAIFKKYEELTGKRITEPVKQGDSPEKKHLKNILNCICNHDRYVADNIQVPSVLIHTILSRCEDDLQTIKDILGNNSRPSLEESIRSVFDCDENVCQLLLLLSGESDTCQNK